MGQAKQRGSFEERKAAAIERDRPKSKMMDIVNGAAKTVKEVVTDPNVMTNPLTRPDKMSKAAMMAMLLGAGTAGLVK